MKQSIRFRCSGCNVRIKAPPDLIGKTRNCPNCGRSFVVRRDKPEDSDPLLVPLAGWHQREEFR